MADEKNNANREELLKGIISDYKQGQENKGRDEEGRQGNEINEILKK